MGDTIFFMNPIINLIEIESNLMHIVILIVIGLAPSMNEILEKQNNDIDTCENDLGVGICPKTKDLLTRL